MRDPIHREGDLGYTLGAGWWGRGLGTEVALSRKPGCGSRAR
ncbi:MAG TPA: hypothetical protein VM598_13855 [Bdellovibrionota bacterium]|nr:hypothetical protein [Bdellovibrionota bacterium]